MNKVIKFTAIGFGGLILLIVLGMVIQFHFDIPLDELKKNDLINNWFIYRIGFYVLFLLLWVPITWYLTRPKINVEQLSDEEKTKFNKQRDDDVRYLQSNWWKFVILFSLFEVVIVRQFGFY